MSEAGKPPAVARRTRSERSDVDRIGQAVWVCRAAAVKIMLKHCGLDVEP